MINKELLCVICNLPMGDKGPSQYAAFGGLPSPCCEHCFEANDYSCKTQEDVVKKSLERRKRLKAFPFANESVLVDTTTEDSEGI